MRTADAWCTNTLGVAPQPKLMSSSQRGHAQLVLNQAGFRVCANETTKHEVDTPGGEEVVQNANEDPAPLGMEFGISAEYQSYVS